MSGLEKRECDPSAGAGQWAAKRTGQLLDATSGVATSDGLIAPAVTGVFRLCGEFPQSISSSVG